MNHFDLYMQIKGKPIHEQLKCLEDLGFTKDMAMDYIDFVNQGQKNDRS